MPSLLTLLAFYNASNEQITLTGVNSNSTASTIVCGLASLPAIPSLYLYYTSSTTNLAYGGSVPVTAGEFSAVVPANCVYTLTYTNTGAAVVMGAGQPAAARPYFLAPFVRNGQVFLTVVGERGRACLIETSSDLETWSGASDGDAPGRHSHDQSAGCNLPRSGGISPRKGLDARGRPDCDERTEDGGSALLQGNTAAMSQERSRAPDRPHTPISTRASSCELH